ncbi:MAG: EamA family transporter [Candidatus Hodarchaeota archaeon]
MLLPILIVLIGTATLNIGFLLQKSEVHKLPNIFVKKSIESFLELFQCRKWILGTFFTSIGWILFLVAVSLAPISLIAPLNNSGIIILALIATIYFGEKFRSFEWIGFGAIIIGIILISFTANLSNVEKNANFDSSLLFLSVLISLLIFSGIGIVQYFQFPNKTGAFLGAASGLFGGLGAVFTKSLTIIFAQGNELVNILANLVLFILSQLLSFVFLQTAFRKERAILVVPLFNSFTTLIPVIIGLIAFYEVITWIQLFGITLILIGSSALFQFSDIAFIERKDN